MDLRRRRLRELESVILRELELGEIILLKV
jgi:hypothetical protein